MITKITKINNLGIFDEYPLKTKPQPKDFKKYNVIYGLNGSGKTTLSKLFESIGEKGERTNFYLNYEIESSNGTYNEKQSFPKEIKVFNKDYIKNNLYFDKGRASPIFLIGEENAKYKKQIDAEKIKLDDIQKKLDDSTAKSKDAIKAKDKLFTNIAKTIKEDKSLLSGIRYDKGNAELHFENMLPGAFISANLSVEELTKNKQTLISEEKEEQEKLNLENKLSIFIHEGVQLCAATAAHKIVQDVIDNLETSDWVEKGLEIHDIKNGIENELITCKFCLNNLDKNRIRALLEHFSQEDKKLKELINALISDIDGWVTEIKNIECVAKEALYIDFFNEYENELNSFKENRIKFLQEIKILINKLESKKNNTGEVITLSININANNLFDSQKRVNDIIIKHNSRVNNIDSEKNDAKKLIEEHHLASIRDDVIANNEIIEDCENNIAQYNNDKRALEEKIDSIKNKISQTYEACKRINEEIIWFFDREEIKLSLLDSDDENEKGYIIEREGKIISDLSEGEKTAIALIYFMIELEKTNDIVVIDDPVSSLDNNFLFNAFSFITSSMNKFHQLFILTHNFDFLKMLLTSYKEAKGGISGKEDDSKLPASKKIRYFMIKNKIIDGNRYAFIDELDKMLEKFNSEYQYLFQELYRFKNMEAPTLDDAYQIPNMIRKFIEIFFEFQFPKASSSPENKLHSLAKENNYTNINENEIKEIIKFLNEKSHGRSKDFDTNVAVLSQKIIKTIFKIAEEENEEHYRRMVVFIDNLSQDA